MQDNAYTHHSLLKIMTLVTIYVWRMLTNPPYRNPVYRRHAVPRVGPEWLRGVGQVLSPAAPALYLMLTVFVCMSIASGSAELLLMLLAGAVFLFNGTFYGMGWTLRLAGELAAERERNVFELLCLLPGGALALVWALATGTMHRENAFRKRYDRHRGLLIAILVLMLALSFAALAGRPKFHGDIVAMYAIILGVLGTSYVDFVQSVVLSALVGTFAGLFTARRFDAELWAALVFLALQVSVYALAAVVGFVLLPPLIDKLGLPAWLTEIVLMALRILALTGTRELVITLIWRVLDARLNTSTAERTRYTR